ncbi:MAG: hypothetical protein LIO62_02740 [Clostridiales bacterium]|nr:hypothetical protein [Clostridiales bacterium]
MNKFDDFNSSIDEEMEFSAMGEVLSNELGVDVPDDVVKDLASEIRAMQTLADMADTMDNEEFGKSISEMMQVYNNSENDEDYELNPIQFGKYLMALSFFENIIEKDSTRGVHSGKINPLEVIPKEQVGRFHVAYKKECPFFIDESELKNFIKIISCCSTVCICNSGDINIEKQTVDILGNIPYVYIHKDKDIKNVEISNRLRADLYSKQLEFNTDERDVPSIEEIGIVNKNKKYELNLAQYKKLLSTIEFFEDVVEESKGMFNEDDEEYQCFKTFPPTLVSNQTKGCVKVEMIMLDVSGAEQEKFCEILSYCSEFKVCWASPLTITIQCTIPDVYVLKQ